MAIARDPVTTAEEPPALAGAASEEHAVKARRPGFVKQNARVLSAVALLGAGIVFLMLGWYGAANTNIFTEQIPYVISGGLLGAALIIVAGVLAATASLESETKRLREDLMRAMSALGSQAPAHRDIRRVLTVPGGRSYHVPGCPIPEGKDVTTLPLDEAAGAGFVPCKLCVAD